MQMLTFFLFLTDFYRFKNAIRSRSLSFLSVALLVCIKRMPTEKEVERDIDGVEVGGDNGFIIGFKDDAKLSKKYGTQLGAIHVIKLPLLTLLKKA